MNDLIHLAMRRAVERFGAKNGLFNGANFSAAFCELAGVANSLDGKVVEAMLCGRADVIQLHGGAHYQFVENKAVS